MVSYELDFILMFVAFLKPYIYRANNNASSLGCHFIMLIAKYINVFFLRGETRLLR